MYTLVNLWELSNHSLFDDIMLPDGINKDIMVNTIFDECAELEPYTIDVDLMKMKIKNFFLRNYDNFKRLYTYTTLEYNPIENYNKYSEIETNNRTNNVNEIKISAYDSIDYQNNTLSTDNNDNKNNVIEHTHGNIGVTTTVQMLEEDNRFWRENNMYDTIAKKFMFTFMITTL